MRWLHQWKSFSIGDSLIEKIMTNLEDERRNVWKKVVKGIVKYAIFEKM
jgi:hypothetical protein